MCWVAGLKQAIFRNAEPELMAMENEGNWGGNFSYRGLTVPSDCKGELKYCIYFQQLCFKPAQCGLRWLKGFICCWHCTLWHCHCQKVKNPICEDFHWACVGMFIYTDEKLIRGRVVQKRFLVSDLLFLYMCRASTQSSGGKNLSTRLLYVCCSILLFSIQFLFNSIFTYTHVIICTCNL